MKRFISKYRHGLVIAVYSIIYILLFSYLEHRPVHSYHIVHTVFDDWIPFCEFFIVPYMLWFPYMILAVIYFIFFNKNKHEYYQLAFNLMMGMTVFLIVSYVYPNAQHIRPTEFPRDNIFTDIVKWLCPFCFFSYLILLPHSIQDNCPASYKTAICQTVTIQVQYRLYSNKLYRNNLHIILTKRYEFFMNIL